MTRYGTDEAVAESTAAAGSNGSWLLRRTAVRIAVLVVLVFVAAVVVVIVVYSSTRAQRGQALPVDVYPGAALVDQHTSPNADTKTYATADSFDAVYAFYAQHIASTDGSGCQKVEIGPAPSGKCFILNAFQDANQYLSVSMQTEDGQSGKTVIVIERSWKG